MSKLTNTAYFLNLFSQESGFKFLTHDMQAMNLDYLSYLYKCQQELPKWKGQVPDEIYELVRGFISVLHGLTSTGRSTPVFAHPRNVWITIRQPDDIL
jgi:hypothetical protein